MDGRDVAGRILVRARALHDETEARRALFNGCNFIGINNRDLKTFEVDLGTTEKLRPLLPDDAIVVAESGISRHADCRRLAGIGIEAFLVGEALMREKDVELSTRALLTGVHG